MLFSTVATPVCIPTKSAQWFLYLHILAITCCFLFFYFSHSDRCEVIISLWFSFAFPDDEWYWASSHICLLAICTSSLEKCLWHLPFFDCFFGVELYQLCILDTKLLSDMTYKWQCKYLPLFSKLSFSFVAVHKLFILM